MQDSTLALSIDTSLQSSAAQARDSTAKAVRRKTREEVKSDSGFKNQLQINTTQSMTSLQQGTFLVAAPAKNTNQLNFYTTHELKVMHHGPQYINRKTPDWIFSVLLLVIAAFAWLRTFYNKYFIQIISAFFNNNLANQIVRDEHILVQRASVMLNMVYYLVAALFLYFLSIHYSWPLDGMGTGLNRYIIFTLIVSATYAVKFLILKICGSLFHIGREMATYLFNIFLINNVLGMLLIPLVALLAFSNVINTSWIVGLSLFFVSGAFCYRIVRGLAIGFASPVFSPYYLFLYLCALEFAPLIVFIKILRQQ